ncbi:MAG: type III PLP-dependent enzyme, partial [Symploca sp. SIO2G7]|nr:type III PLP-dependent enzyme [Symploca sp. SIO2G7]
MEQVTNLVSQYFGTSNRELHFGGIPVGKLAAEYGTPLFVYDSQALNQKWNLLRKTLPPEFAISYSVKANPNPAILKFFLDRGGGLEIASAGEFHRALSAGCPPDEILFAGPGKTPAELELVLSKGIGEIHIESLLEAQRISAISSKLGVPAKVAVRVNPTGDAQGGAMRMGGKPLPFGVDEETLDTVLDQILPDQFLDFQGLHLFTGTQILDYEILVDQYRKGLEIAKRVAQRLEHPLHTIDFGGGLGIPYFAKEQELDMEKLREQLAVLMAQIKDEPLFAGTKLMVEPGRYL